MLQAVVMAAARRRDPKLEQSLEEWLDRDASGDLGDEIPAAVVFRADYGSGTITTTLVNVDRFDRVSLAFRSNALKEQLLEELLKFILGMDRAFLHNSRLAGIQGRPTRS